MFEPPRTEEIDLAQASEIELLMVADRPGLTPDEATQRGYILVDWGTPFMIAHSDHFPELPTPSLRLGQGLMALDLLRQLGGAAYLPMVEGALSHGDLFLVEDAPLIPRQVYAAFRPSGADRADLREALRALKAAP